jgi:menaquinone-9 beta-reductase
MRRTRALIVGGGPAGSMAAIRLAEAGKRPLLFERTRGAHDIVCGGFLGWDALAMLDRAGIDAFVLGAQTVRQLHLVAGHRTALIDLPHEAAGLSRATLDAALLSRAADAGAAIERGVTVRQIDPESRSVNTGSGESVAAEAIFLATGKHDLRGAPRNLDLRDDIAIGMRVRLDPTTALRRALEQRIELILLNRGYAGLVLQEDGSANLCFTIARSRLDEAGGDRDRLLAALAGEAPVLGERIGQSNGLGGWASIARVPYGWRTDATRPGLFRLGDQAAVIASLAGDGIAIALASARIAADHYIKHGPEGALAFQSHFSRVARRPLWFADRLRSMAESSGLAPAGIATLARFPAAARAASRVTRIGAY